MLFGQSVAAPGRLAAVPVSGTANQLGALNAGGQQRVAY